jgi:hypothetical protein
MNCWADDESRNTNNMGTTRIGVERAQFESWAAI